MPRWGTVHPHRILFKRLAVGFQQAFDFVAKLNWVVDIEHIAARVGNAEV